MKNKCIQCHLSENQWLFFSVFYKCWKRNNSIQEEFFGILTFFFFFPFFSPYCTMALGTTTMSIQFMCCFSYLVCACNYRALQVRNQNILHVSNLNLVLNVLKNSCFSVQRILKSPSGEGKLLNGCSKWFSVSGYFQCNSGNCFLPSGKWISDSWSK